MVLFLKLSVIYKKECVQGTFDGPPVVDESESKGREKECVQGTFDGPPVVDESESKGREGQREGQT